MPPCCSEWGRLTHCFVDEANKNVVKEKLGLKSVPFLLIVQKVGVTFLPRKDGDCL